MEKNIKNFLKKYCCFYNAVNGDLFFVGDVDYLTGEKVKILLCTTKEIDFGDDSRFVYCILEAWPSIKSLNEIINSESVFYLGNESNKKIAKLKEKCLCAIRTKEDFTSHKIDYCAGLSPNGITVKKFKEILAGIPDSYTVHGHNSTFDSIPIVNNEIKVDNERNRLIL